MNIYFILLLRIIHIFGGVLWVGAAILYFGFIEPTIKSIGPAGGQFMQHFIERQKYSVYMSIVSILTVVSGVPLYLFASGGLQLRWIQSGPGSVFTIGSVVAILVFFMGFLMIKPRAERMGALSKEIGMSGGAPNPAQAAELHKLDGELSKIGRIEFVLLSISMLTMATARYWNF
jgi:uncharacterized membrane protein